MKTFRSIKLALAACAGVLALSSSASAALLVYEGFNYTAGANALNSKNGGTGYSAAYLSTNNAGVVSGSFSYTHVTSQPLLTSRNRAFMDSTTVGAPARAAR